MVVELPLEPVWQATCTLLAALAAASLGTWALPHVGLAAAHPGLGLAIVWTIAGVAAAGTWRLGRSAAARLAWTGQAWRLWTSAPPTEPTDPAFGCTASSQACAPQVMLDLGTWMLLRLGARGGLGGPAWVAVSARGVGPSWHGLRVALYCAPSEPADEQTTPRSCP